MTDGVCSDVPVCLQVVIVKGIQMKENCIMCFGTSARSCISDISDISQF